MTLVFSRATRRAGVGVRFHDLRYPQVFTPIESGEHPKLISTWMGHASSSFTLDRYGHLFRGMDQGAARGLDSAYFGETPIAAGECL